MDRQVCIWSCCGLPTPIWFADHAALSLVFCTPHCAGINSLKSRAVSACTCVPRPRELCWSPRCGGKVVSFRADCCTLRRIFDNSWSSTYQSFAQALRSSRTACQVIADEVRSVILEQARAVALRPGSHAGRVVCRWAAARWETTHRQLPRFPESSDSMTAKHDTFAWRSFTEGLWSTCLNSCQSCLASSPYVLLSTRTRWLPS